jgi:hypothetical protein
MTKLFGLCPRCKSRIKINNVERLDGRKIACRDCGYTIRIRAKAALSGNQRPSDELEILDEEDEPIHLVEPDDLDLIEDDDEEFVVVSDDAAAYRPLSQRPKPKKKAPQETEEAAAAAGSFVPAQKSGGRKGKASPLKIGLIAGGVLLLAGALGGGFILFNGGFFAPGKFEAPEKYVKIPMGFVPFAGQMPEGWNATSGGGMRGVPIFVRIWDPSKSISIDIRETEGSSAKGQMKKRLLSGQEVNQIGGPPHERIGEAPAVANTHSYHLGVVTKSFLSYKEGSSRSIDTGFGEGLLSDFTGKESIFSSTVKGIRASLVHRDHQYNIICECAPSQFKDVKPVFEKIIASLNPDEGPGGDH